MTTPRIEARKDIVLVFHCYHCGKDTWTVKRDFGPIRLTISCRATGFGTCRGSAALHDIDPGRDGQPEWEWVTTGPKSSNATENMAVAQALLLSPLVLRKIQEVIPAESPSGGSSG